MFNILQMFANPQMAIQNLMGSMMQNNFQNNPLFERAKQMANGKSDEQLMQTAKNLCKQQGIDFDTAFAQFKQQYKL